MSKVKVKYKKNAPQEEFHKDIITPMLMFCGGLGSGKTFALCMKALLLSALNKDVSGGFLCPSFPDYKKDILPTFEEILSDANLLPYCKINRTDKYIIFPWSKAPLYIHTAEKHIKGPNYGYALINEFSSIPLERVQELINRVRVKDAPCRQINFAGTPEDVYGWLEDFIEKHEAQNLLRVIRGKTTDNEHLAPEYIEHLKATLDPLQFRLFAEGELIQLSTNRFYYAFSADRNNTDIDLDPMRTIHIGLDFNVGNMHAVIGQVHEIRRKKVMVLFDQIVLKDFGSDTRQMASAIKKRHGDYLDQILITCDFSGAARKTTGPSDVLLLRDAGFEVRYRAKGNVRLKKRQLLVNGLLSHGQILVNKERCPVLWKDMNKVLQKEDFTKDKTNPDLTHASDGLDYLIDFEFEIKERQRFNIGKSR